jgi:uncharacterized membrane protein YraQ (UPF0718 family)
VTLATAVLVVLALAMLAYAWMQGDGSHLKGIEFGWQTMRRTAPLLLIAFVIVGYVEALGPEDLIQRWIGPESGLGGILLAEGLGMLLPGGPYAVFPIIAVLYQAGAGLAPTITLITSWATLALISVSFELPFMGWRFSAVRWGLGLVIPLVAGIAARLLFGG